MDRMPLCFYGCTMAASERLTSVVLSSSRCCSIEAFNAFQPLSRRPRSVRFLPAFPSPAESSWRQSGRRAVHRHGDVVLLPPRASALSVWKVQYHGTVRAQHSTAQYGTARTIYCSYFAASASGPVGSEVLASLFSFPFPGARDDVAVLRPKRTSTSPFAIPAGVFLLALASSAGSPPRPARRGRRKWEKGEPRPSAARPSNRGGVDTVMCNNNDGSPMPFATVPYRTIPRARPSPSAQRGVKSARPAAHEPVAGRMTRRRWRSIRPGRYISILSCCCDKTATPATHDPGRGLLVAGRQLCAHDTLHQGERRWVCPPGDRGD